MSEPNPAHRPSPKTSKRNFLQKVADLLHREPESRADLMAVLSTAEDHGLISAESRIMVEGVLRLADLDIADVMVPAPRVDMLDIDASHADMLDEVIGNAHSRIPVYSERRDNIIGILHAKDLLKLQRAPDLSLRALLRPANFVPETKGLNDLLREFRHNHAHMAIVINEFGSVSGLITIEDVLEEIVGEIEDEFDAEDGDDGDVFTLADNTWRISGDTPLERIAEAFALPLTALHSRDVDEEFDTIGGLIAHEMGHVPAREEVFDLAGLHFQVLYSKGGVVRWFKVSRCEGHERPAAP